MKMRHLLGRDLCLKGPFEEDYESANERECTRIRKIVDRRLRIEDEEEADSSKGSASVSLAVSRILRDTFYVPVGRCGLAAPNAWAYGMRIRMRSGSAVMMAALARSSW